MCFTEHQYIHSDIVIPPVLYWASIHHLDIVIPLVHYWASIHHLDIVIPLVLYWASIHHLDIGGFVSGLSQLEVDITFYCCVFWFQGWVSWRLTSCSIVVWFCFRVESVGDWHHVLLLCGFVSGLSQLEVDIMFYCCVVLFQGWVSWRLTSCSIVVWFCFRVESAGGWHHVLLLYGFVSGLSQLEVDIMFYCCMVLFQGWVSWRLTSCSIVVWFCFRVESAGGWHHVLLLCGFVSGLSQLEVDITFYCCVVLFQGWVSWRLTSCSIVVWFCFRVESAVGWHHVLLLCGFVSGLSQLEVDIMFYCCMSTSSWLNPETKTHNNRMWCQPPADSTLKQNHTTIERDVNLQILTSSATVCGDRTSCTPAAKRLASVAPEVDLGEHTLRLPPQCE